MTHNFQCPSLPPTEALIAFRLTRDHGSYASAARAEGVNHATILRRVAALETWLGTKLFEREGRGVTLTPAGQRFAYDVEDFVNALARSADRWRPGPSPTRISLSVLPSFARLHLMPVLPVLLHPEHSGGSPRWRIEVSVSHRPVSLGDGNHDVAIRYGRGPWEGLAARPLPEERLEPALHRDLVPEAFWQVPMDAAAIATLPLIHDSDVSDWRRWFEARGLPYRLKAADLRLEDYDLALDVARRGLGVLLLRRTGRSVPPPLVVCEDCALQNPRRHWILTAADENRPAVVTFVERLQEILDERLASER